MSTPIRGCAWPRRWPATGAPSAALRCPSGFAEVLVRARELAPSGAATAIACGLAESDVAHFFELFHATPNTVTAFSQGVNQSAQGTDKVSAIINCHLVTGRFGRASNMAPREGLKAVQMFEAIERGEIKALWVMATNPAVSLPRARAVREALGKLDLFVVSDNVLSNDTITAGAQILLPAAAWGEKDGTVTNSERRISRQRPFLTLPGEARPDWGSVAG